MKASICDRCGKPVMVVGKEGVVATDAAKLTVELKDEKGAVVLSTTGADLCPKCVTSVTNVIWDRILKNKLAEVPTELVPAKSEKEPAKSVGEAAPPNVGMRIVPGAPDLKKRREAAEARKEAAKRA